MELEHFSHEHPLILNEEESLNIGGKQVVRCDGCWVSIISSSSCPSYSCSLGCNFHLHKSCAQLPPKIEHPLHSGHPLKLFAKSPYPFSSCKCDHCRETISNAFTYHCSLCKFDLDIVCAFPTVLNIQHKSHNHPLFPLRNMAKLHCEGCGRRQEGCFYGCGTCFQTRSQFFIHRDCVLLPTTFKHSGHDHILNLAYSIPSEYTTFSLKCKICSEELDCRYWSYHCGGCRYFIHVYCPTKMEIETKINNLKAFFNKEASKAEPSLAFTNSRDSEKGTHLLQLLSGNLQLQEKDCKSNIEIEDLTRDTIHFPVPTESVSLVSHLTHFLKEMKLEENNKEKSIELNHFSHEHPLIFFDVQSEDDILCSGSELSLTNDTGNRKMCNGCMQLISSSPFYNCAQCDFFLHKCCANLPTEVLHPCHPLHPLTLIEKASTSLGLLKCNYCRQPCDGFVFHCDDCQLYLDVKCGLLPRVIVHEAHQLHPLVLREASIERFWCNACGDRVHNEPGFGCSACDFHLDLYCSLLPRTVRHRYDVHPFTLTYSPLKDHPQEYICEICEEELDPTLWFYHCVECDQSLHPLCFAPRPNFAPRPDDSRKKRIQASNWARRRKSFY